MEREFPDYVHPVPSGPRRARFLASDRRTPAQQRLSARQLGRERGGTPNTAPGRDGVTDGLGGLRPFARGEFPRNPPLPVVERPARKARPSPGDTPCPVP